MLAPAREDGRHEPDAESIERSNRALARHGEQKRWASEERARERSERAADEESVRPSRHRKHRGALRTAWDRQTQRWTGVKWRGRRCVRRAPIGGSEPKGEGRRAERDAERPTKESSCLTHVAQAREAEAREEGERANEAARLARGVCGEEGFEAAV